MSNRSTPVASRRGFASLEGTSTEGVWMEGLLEERMPSCDEEGGGLRR